MSTGTRDTTYFWLHRVPSYHFRPCRVHCNTYRAIVSCMRRGKDLSCLRETASFAADCGFTPFLIELKHFFMSPSSSLHDCAVQFGRDERAELYLLEFRSSSACPSWLLLRRGNRFCSSLMVFMEHMQTSTSVHLPSHLHVQTSAHFDVLHIAIHACTA